MPATKVMVDAAWFNAFMVGIIVLAGILVGVSSYPSMSGNTDVKRLDLLVQISFTIECALKVLREGRNPWLYW
jgi:hypothetical protein